MLARGVVPVLIGGDDSLPIPMLQALADVGRRVTILQIDAHIDFVDVRHGVREGHGNPMRRAAEPVDSP